MNITFLCSDEEHPVNAYLKTWIDTIGKHHSVELIRKKAEANGGDILFLISCSEIITARDRAKYDSCLVLHASDLPRGRGWSPHIWELIQGAEFVTLTLLEADDKVDSGRIWKKMPVVIPEHALWNEINHLLFEAEIQLINYALDNYYTIEPGAQSDESQATYYSRRTPEDSRIDPFKSIAEQFDLIRVCDPGRFPPFFEYRGQRYLLKLEKSNE